MIRIGIHFDLESISIGPMLRPDSVSAVPSATPSSSTGNAQITSRLREMTVSVKPRK